MRNLFGLHLLTAQDARIRQLKRTHRCAVHGQKVWRSASVLLDYLQEYPLAKGLRVLELGAGWGLAGIYCAKYAAAAVTALDIDPAVLPYLQLHAHLNEVAITPWTADFTELSAAQLSQFDVIIGSDICFWDQLSEPLLQLINRAQQLNIRAIIADPGRPPFIEVIETLLDQPAGKTLAVENWSVPHPYNVHGVILDTGAPYVEL
ncbi:MAG TPA: methyltransferase domain-containing protein [Marinagarivorans sp.]|nr:methyltransferase domain-containing protein [Marinagarivorans sp.]HNG59653.1 methyltransferase domain-containing protein [Cellvibrionaceae bacterium]